MAKTEIVASIFVIFKDVLWFCSGSVRSACNTKVSISLVPHTYRRVSLLREPSDGPCVNLFDRFLPKGRKDRAVWPIGNYIGGGVRASSQKVLVQRPYRERLGKLGRDRLRISRNAADGVPRYEAKRFSFQTFGD